MQVTFKRILRWPAVMQATGRSRASLHNDIKRGVFPTPIKIGPNAAGVPEDEVGAVNAAKIAGATEDEIRALVRRLIEARKQAEAA